MDLPKMKNQATINRKLVNCLRSFSLLFNSYKRAGSEEKVERKKAAE